MSFFRYIVIFLVVWWIIRTVGRMIARIRPGGGQQSHGNPGFKNSKRNGSIDINYVPGDGKKSKTSQFKGGEYVDYEEVD